MKRLLCDIDRWCEKWNNADGKGGLGVARDNSEPVAFVAVVIYVFACSFGMWPDQNERF